MEEAGSWQTRTSDFYSELSGSWTNTLASRSKFLSTIDGLIRHELENSTSILDIGSGDGSRIRNTAGGKVQRLVMVEPSDLSKHVKQLDLTREVLITEPFETADFTDFGTFDAITLTWNVLGHVYDPIEVLKKARALVNPGGKIALDVNNFLNISEYGFFAVSKNLLGGAKTYRTFRISKPGAGNQIDVRLFSKKVVKQLLSSSGFEDSHIRFVNYSSGKAVRSQFRGQIFAVAKAPG